MDMKAIPALALLGSLLGGAVQAQAPESQVCGDQAQRLALGGEALADFMGYCTARQAADRLMAGNLWFDCQQRTRVATGRTAAISTHVPPRRVAMKECMEGR